MVRLRWPSTTAVGRRPFCQVRGQVERGPSRSVGSSPASSRSQSEATRWPRAPCASGHLVARTQALPARRSRAGRATAGEDAARAAATRADPGPGRGRGVRLDRAGATGGARGDDAEGSVGVERATRPAKKASATPATATRASVTRRTTAPLVALASAAAMPTSASATTPEATSLPAPGDPAGAEHGVVDGAADPRAARRTPAARPQPTTASSTTTGLPVGPQPAHRTVLMAAAVATARRAAAALLTVSSYSAVGTRVGDDAGARLHVRRAAA